MGNLQSEVRSTVSIGTTSYSADGGTLDLLLARADRNMYQAKLAGCNRVFPQAATPDATITDA